VTHTGGLPSSIGLAFYGIAFVVGIALGGFMFFVLGAMGQPSEARLQTEWRVAFICLASIEFYQFGINGSLNALWFHAGWRDGMYWVVVLPIVVSWGCAIGYGICRRAAVAFAAAAILGETPDE
jgi:hypothetical protein